MAGRFGFFTLRRAPARGGATPPARAPAGGAAARAAIVGEVIGRVERRGDDGVWISRVPEGLLLDEAAALERRAAAEGVAHLPLYGIPFAVKDNIDVAGLPTTAGCPEFA